MIRLIIVTSYRVVLKYILRSAVRQTKVKFRRENIKIAQNLLNKNKKKNYDGHSTVSGVFFTHV